MRGFLGISLLSESAFFCIGNVSSGHRKILFLASLALGEFLKQEHSFSFQKTKQTK